MQEIACAGYLLHLHIIHGNRVRPAKDAINRAKHGLSLADASAFELSEAIVEQDTRFDYGEVRLRAFGRIDGEARCLVFTMTGNAIRIISYRRAHEKEMRRYGL